MRERITTLGWGALLLATGIAYHLHDMQVTDSKYWTARARQNTIVIDRVDAPRGRIYDRNGRLLVTNEPDFQLVAVPAELKVTPARLAEVGFHAHKPVPAMLANMLKGRKKAPLEPVVLARGLDMGQVARITPLVEGVRGLALRIKERRRYLFPGRASHIFGYVGEITAEQLRDRRKKGFRMGDALGQAGLEKVYDDQLRGRKGIRHLYIDALGRTVRSVEIRPPRAGYDLHLTLDWRLQMVAEKALQETLDQLRQKNGEASSGAVVVMEARTGRVLALVGLPGYDLRPFGRGIRPHEFAKLVSDPAAPLVHRAYQASFSPGSTFKIINSSASLQEGLCTPGTVFHCGGSYMGANCFVTSGHGAISFEHSIAHSCDVVYYMLAVKQGIDTLGRHCRDFGLGAPTGLDLPAETGGLLPTRQWKQRELDDPWRDGDTVNMGIGQGFLLVSPLQMAVATAAVANGGHKVRPYLVEKAVSAGGRVGYQGKPRKQSVNIKPAHLAAVRKGMRGAVVYGTGGAANSELITVAGKTGTVESFPSPFNPHGRNHTWFVSFAPYEKPEIVVVAFVEKSGDYGGSVAAPIARQVIDAYARTRVRPR